MAIKAKDLNYDYIGLSEHNPSQSNHSDSQATSLIKKRNAEAERIEKKHKLKIFKLMETDIKPDGSLALPESSLEILELSKKVQEHGKNLFHSYTYLVFQFLCS